MRASHEVRTISIDVLASGSGCSVYMNVLCMRTINQVFVYEKPGGLFDDYLIFATFSRLALVEA